MKHLKIAFISIVAILTTSCFEGYIDTGFTPAEPQLSFQESSVTSLADATTVEIHLSSNLPWMVSCDATWVSITPSRGTGDALLTVTIQRNRTVEQRTGTITASVTDDATCAIGVVQDGAASGGVTIYYVKADGDASASGLSWANATTLANAIDMAADNDTIYVAQGTYTPETPLTNSASDNQCNKTFEVHSNFALIGGFPADANDDTTTPGDYDPTAYPTTLSGTIDNSITAYHVVTVTAPIAEGKKVVIKGFTIRDGSSSTDGDSTVSVNGNALQIGYGAGMMIGASKVEIADCMVTENVAGAHAAGIFIKPGAVVAMENCIITRNESKFNAGGLWNCGATLYMNRCTISDNISAQQAAGLYSIDANGSTSTSRIYNSTISGNDATSVNAGRSGGGAYIREYSDAVFVNCTFSGNKAGNGGGIQGYGASNKTSKLTLISCTFVGNSATLVGGGISLWNNYNTTKIYNCIISGNTAASGNDIGYGSNVSDNTKLSYSTSIVGSNLYGADGVQSSGWAFDTTTMLSAFGSWGGPTETYSLIVGSSNAACSEGLSKADLAGFGATVTPVVESKVFDTDQRGVERGDKKTIGACTTE